MDLLRKDETDTISTVVAVDVCPCALMENGDWSKRTLKQHNDHTFVHYIISTVAIPFMLMRKDFILKC